MEQVELLRSCWFERKGRSGFNNSQLAWRMAMHEIKVPTDLSGVSSKSMNTVQNSGIWQLSRLAHIKPQERCS